MDNFIDRFVKKEIEEKGFAGAADTLLLMQLIRKDLPEHETQSLKIIFAQNLIIEIVRKLAREYGNPLAEPTEELKNKRTVLIDLLTEIQKKFENFE